MRPKTRLSIAQAEDRNAPGSIFSPFDPLADLIPPDSAGTPVQAAPSVITVSGPDAPGAAPQAVELVRPPAESAATPATVGVPAGRVADPFAATILWDPGTLPEPVYLGGSPAQPVAGPGQSDGSDPTAGPNVTFQTAAATPGQPTAADAESPPSGR